MKELLPEKPTHLSDLEYQDDIMWLTLEHFSFVCAAANNSFAVAWLQIWVNMSRIYHYHYFATIPLCHYATCIFGALQSMQHYRLKCRVPFGISLDGPPLNFLTLLLIPESWLPLPGPWHVYIPAIWIHLRPDPGHHRDAMGPELRLADGGNAWQVRTDGQIP